MNNIFKKHNDVFSNIFDKNEIKDNNDLINQNKDVMPEPTDYRISTMTMITSFNTNR